MSEWRGFVPADRTAMNVIRKTVSAALPKSVKKRVKAAMGRG
jgi:hypothetical protein